MCVCVCVCVCVCGVCVCVRGRMGSGLCGGGGGGGGGEEVSECIEKEGYGVGSVISPQKSLYLLCLVNLKVLHQTDTSFFNSTQSVCLQP